MVRLSACRGLNGNSTAADIDGGDGEPAARLLLHAIQIQPQAAFKVREFEKYTSLPARSQQTFSFAVLVSIPEPPRQTLPNKYSTRTNSSIQIVPCVIQPSGVIKWICLPMHTHSYPLGTFKWPSAITKLTAHYMWLDVCLLWLFASKEIVWSYMTLNVLTETRCD